jgi:hypothetical protein
LPLIPVRSLRKIGLIRSSLDDRVEISRGALFHGDVPVNHRCPAVGTLEATRGPTGHAVNFVCAADYVQKRSVSSVRQNVVYTPAGFAWTGTHIDTALSARNIYSAKALLLDSLQRRGQTIPQGTIVESHFPNTYGDWTTEQIKSIALCPDFPRPLVLPAAIAARKYVQKELDRLGITFIAAQRPVRIRETFVLHKPRPGTLWIAEEAMAYQRLFGITPPQPRKGSILYLSRIDVKSEQKAAVRDYRSATIANIVKALGGRVVETGGIGRDDYAALAAEAETVIADHGSASLNLLQWKTRNLIEIVTDNWWGISIIFAGLASGVENHAVVCCNRYDETELGRLIEGHLRAFGALG